MHDLHAKSFFQFKKFYLAAVCFLLFWRSLYCPVDVCFCDKIRDADHRNPVKCTLVSIIYFFCMLLPPESFQRRNNIFKESLYLVICFVTHLQCICHCVQSTDCLLIYSSFFIWISLSTDSDITHFGYLDNLRFSFGQIKLSLFLLKIKRHPTTPSKIQPYGSFHYTIFS